MKILESYKEIARELFREGDLGENPYAQGKEPKPGDWWKSSEGQDYDMGKDGERQGTFNDAEDAEEYAKGQVDGDDGEDSGENYQALVILREMVENLKINHLAEIQEQMLIQVMCQKINHKRQKI